MRSIDVHAHMMPQSFFHAVDNGQEWHGATVERDANNIEWKVTGPRRELIVPKFRWTPEEGLADMHDMSVDVHVLSNSLGSYEYSPEEEKTYTAMVRECNDEISQMVKSWPQHFVGLATLPTGNIKSAIAELERAMTQLGLKGAMIGDHANERLYDEPEYLPFWKAAEEMGALLFIHQKNRTIVYDRIPRYHLNNTIGNLVERAMTFGALVFGGVMDKFPDLKICMAHGGGYICMGIGRMDRGWLVRPEARVNIQQPPSAYLRRFYYDCLTHDEAALRFLVETVGADRVVLGSDWPADMALDWPTTWVLGIPGLTTEQKELILHKNLEDLLGI